MSEVNVKGNTQERSTFSECFRHYTMSREDLDKRIIDFDKKDILFRSHIVKENWPYRSIVFDPRIFTILYEKTARTFANKPRGRMLPRQSGDAIGAKINSEILSFQWDDNERVDGQSMLAKWALTDLNTRKYGAAFGFVPWHWQRQVQQKMDDKTGKPTGKSTIYFDGPNFVPWANRDVLHNPSYSTIKNWIQLRSYVTLNELENINDAARAKSVYKNLDLLKTSILATTSGGGDTRAANYIVKNLNIKGLQDYLGRDPSFKTIEIVRELRNERWITFAPKHGVVIRDIPNPYDHGQIPVILNKYYPIDDDIYGLSEIEPLEKLQKALNAYICQNLDQLNLNTYVPLKVNSQNGAVQMHTLNFGPGAKWLMNNPSSDVLAHEQGEAGVEQFIGIYRMMVGAMQEAAGETSAAISTQVPGSGNKTATEIRDTAMSRSARDNFNQIFLAEAMKKQSMFWYKMNQQFFFNANEEQKIIHIAGKEAIKFFQGAGLDADGLDDEGIDQLTQMADWNHTQMSENGIPPDQLPDLGQASKDLAKPLFPMKTKEGVVNKMKVDTGGQGASLILEKDDLAGDYDYIPDVGSMGQNASEEEINAKADFMSRVTGVDPKTGQPTGIAAMMQQEGKKVKATDLVVDYAEDIGFKNADQYIENIPQQTQPNPMEGGQIDPTTGQPIQGGAGPTGTPGALAGTPNLGAGGNQGIQPGAQAIPA